MTPGGRAERDQSLAEIERCLGPLLPGDVATALWKGGRATLRAEEAGYVSGAVEKRRAEFARGRACARAALEQLGAPDGPIPVGPAREPVWPEGFTGSITHCEGLVCAAVARRDRVESLGIDAEVLRALDDEMASLVLTPEEVAGEIPGDPRRLVVFSSKEAVFKAVYPVTRQWLDFLDVRLRVDWRMGTFRAELVPGASRYVDLTTLRGRFAVTGGFVLSACWLPAVPDGAVSGE